MVSPLGIKNFPYKSCALCVWSICLPIFFVSTWYQSRKWSWDFFFLIVWWNISCSHCVLINLSNKVFLIWIISSSGSMKGVIWSKLFLAATTQKSRLICMFSNLDHFVVMMAPFHHLVTGVLPLAVSWMPPKVCIAYVVGVYCWHPNIALACIFLAYCVELKMVTEKVFSFDLIVAVFSLFSIVFFGVYICVWWSDPDWFLLWYSPLCFVVADLFQSWHFLCVVTDQL